MEPVMTYPLEEAITAIEDANIIVLGPGSLYTSVIPNLLVNDMVNHIYESKADVVYISNVMTQPGETDRYTVFEHLKAILDHSREDLIDYCIANIEEIPEETLERYKEDGAKPVILTKEDEIKLSNMGITVIKDNLVDVKKDYVRHDSLRISEILINL